MDEYHNLIETFRPEIEKRIKALQVPIPAHSPMSEELNHQSGSGARVGGRVKLGNLLHLDYALGVC